MFFTVRFGYELIMLHTCMYMSVYSTLYRYRQTGYEERCLEQITNIVEAHTMEQMPQFNTCNSDNRFQLWLINYHFEYKYVPDPLFPGDVRFTNYSTT